MMHILDICSELFLVEVLCGGKNSNCSNAHSSPKTVSLTVHPQCAIDISLIYPPHSTNFLWQHVTPLSPKIYPFQFLLHGGTYITFHHPPALLWCCFIGKFRIFKSQIIPCFASNQGEANREKERLLFFGSSSLNLESRFWILESRFWNLSEHLTLSVKA